jgi:NADH-quinone oxidoreductase subunit N
MNIMLFAPELFLLTGALVLFLLSLSPAGAGRARTTALVFAIGTMVSGLVFLNFEGTLFYNAYQIDFFSQLIKVILAAGLAVVLLIGRKLKGIADEVRAEYYLFLFMSTLGLMMLVSSVELLTLFIALELSSYSLYLLVPMRDDRAGSRLQMEAAVKYILFGVVATGIMLFGMSYLFGLTGTTYLGELLTRLQPIMAQPAAIVGLAMVMCGFFYKLAVFPFHFWVPDVYQGASNETTTFIASVPKIAAVALLIRMATMIAAPGGWPVVNLLVVLSVLSMFYGNLAALVQKDIKRMLGFSGIAHAGYVLLGILTLGQAGYATAMYYITGYLVMNLACFLVICAVSPKGENLQIDDLSGLHQRSPLLALTLAVGMFALAGIPPFVGFMGKFMLLANALNEGYLTLVILAAINTAISIFYYLSVVRVAYTTSPEGYPAVQVAPATKLVSVLLMLVIIAMGILPTPVLEIATSAVRVLL